MRKIFRTAWLLCLVSCKNLLLFAALNASELRDELVMTALDGPYKSRSFHLR